MEPATPCDRIPPEAPVYLVLADPAERRALEEALLAAQHGVRSFGTAGELWCACRTERPGCVVIDLELPDGPGIAALERLRGARDAPPALIAARGTDVATAVRAMRAGAFDFLEKPVDPAVLVERTGEALALDARRCAARRHRREARRLLTSLTPREVEVVRLVVAGRANKEIARELAIAAKTVEFHRAHAMRKLGAGHVSDLVRLALAAPAFFDAVRWT